MAFFESHDWNTGFVCWTLLLCLVVRYLCLCFVFVYYLEYEFVYIWLSQRFITIFTLSAVVNLMRKNIHPIGWNEQFIMAYGGLRGAVGFSLVRYLYIRMFINIYFELVQTLFAARCLGLASLLTKIKQILWMPSL